MCWRKIEVSSLASRLSRLFLVHREYSLNNLPLWLDCRSYCALFMLQSRCYRHRSYRQRHVVRHSGMQMCVCWRQYDLGPTDRSTRKFLSRVESRQSSTSPRSSLLLSTHRPLEHTRFIMDWYLYIERKWCTYTTTYSQPSGVAHYQTKAVHFLFQISTTSHNGKVLIILFLCKIISLWNKPISLE